MVVGRPRRLRGLSPLSSPLSSRRMRRTARYAVLLAGVLSLGLPGTAEAEHPPPQRTGQTWTAGTVTITETTTPAAYEHENSWRCDGRRVVTVITGCKAHRVSTDTLPAATRNSDGTFSPPTATTRCPGVQECGHGSGNSGWTYTGHRNVKIRDAVTTRAYTCTSGGSTTTVTQAESAHCGAWTANTPSCPAGDTPSVSHRHASGAHTVCRVHEPSQPACPTPATGSWTWNPGPGHQNRAMSWAGCDDPPEASCSTGWHNHAAGTGHGQACRARHSVPSCALSASGVWTPGHALGEPGHARVSGLRVCPQPAASFCADSGHNVWTVTIERQHSNNFNSEANPSWLLPAGYHRNRIPSGGNLGHSQFLPSLMINNARSPDTADLKIGEWTPAWAIAPQAPARGSVTAVDWDWDGERFRSCGTMSWTRTGVTWRSSDARLELDPAGRRVRWTGTECSASAMSPGARLTVTAQWEVRIDHRIVAYDKTETAETSRSWRVRCTPGATRIWTVCDTADLGQAALRGFGALLRPKLYRALHASEQHRWKGSVPPSSDWNRVIEATPQEALPEEVSYGGSDDRPPMVLLRAPVAVTAANYTLDYVFDLGRMPTAGRSPQGIRVTRSDGTPQDCGRANFELLKLTWAAEGASARAVPSVTNTGSGYRQAQGTPVDLPRVCSRPVGGWGTAGTSLGFNRCAGAMFFAVDIHSYLCRSPALTLTADWRITLAHTPGTAHFGTTSSEQARFANTALCYHGA